MTSLHVRWVQTRACVSVFLISSVYIALLVVRPGSREPPQRRVLLQLHHRNAGAGVQGLKNLVIDRVYFPKGRHDAGLAKVHGVVNGKYVEGTLRIQRTAAYNPKEGAWTGVSQQPLVEEQRHYNRAVEKVVASAITSAMKDMLRTNGSAAAVAPNLPESYLDPEQSITQEVYRTAGQAIANVFAGEGDAGESSQQLRARAPVRKRSLRNFLAKRAVLAKQRDALQALPQSASTVGGCRCRSSFAFGGVARSGCIRSDSDRAWCLTEGECGTPSQQARGQFWDFCEPPLTRTVKGCECQLPFSFRGEQQRSCIDASRTFLYGEEAAPGKGPRGTWCQTRGHCGEGQFEGSGGVRAFWDRCDLPGPAATPALAERAGPGGAGAMCGATAGDLGRHRRAFEFSGECGAGLVCGWSCARPEFCPSCAGGNCRCTPQKRAGEACGEGSNRPPAYAHYECASGQCLFACADPEKCNDCNGGKCKCK